MNRPWDRPHDREDEISKADKVDLVIDLWTLDVLRGIGAALVVINQNQLLLAKGMKKIMATQAEILAAVLETASATGDKADAAAARVIKAFNDNNEVVLALQEHNAEDDAAIEELKAQIAAGEVDPAAAQAVLDKLTEVQGKIDGIAADPIEVPV